MRIAMVCPLDRAVSPTAEGNPYRVIGELAAALAADGHQVTLFAAEGSSGGSELVVCSGPAGQRPGTGAQGQAGLSTGRRAGGRG